MNKAARLASGGVAMVWLAGSSGGEPASRPSVPGIQPIAYFQQNCARCHGDYGSNYGDQFARNLDDAKLSKVVDEMCSGPGNAPLSGVDLQAEIAFHRALVDRKPFLCVTQIEGDAIRGEVSPNAAITFEDEHQKQSAKVDGTTWTVTIDRSRTHSMKLVATLNGHQTILESKASTTLFSHDHPIARPTTEP